MATRIERATRWWYVLRYHRSSQLAGRLASIARRKWLGWTGGPRNLAPPGPLACPKPNAAIAHILDWKLRARQSLGASRVAERVLASRFKFLNHELSLPDPVDGRNASLANTPALWRFQLHYHEFLLDLVAHYRETGASASVERAWQLAADWIAGNQAIDSRTLADAWHPFCISRRLLAWILLWTACPPDSNLAPTVLASMFSQAEFLRRNLERDLGGNHLLENARGLILAGTWLDCPQAGRWFSTGAEIIRRELAQQVLPCGEHFERSPMYHAQMLDLLLDVQDALAEQRPDLARRVAQATAEMAEFLGAILHPDGRIPLLGDSCHGETPPAELLLARASGDDWAPASQDAHTTPVGSAHPSAVTRGEYWIFRHGGDFLLFDRGPVGADHLPAHAHADLLSFEASIDGHRVFVDSGVFNYEADDMRRYCRSTAAHNTLEIDGLDQCSMWSRFRMGYRGWPAGFDAGESTGFCWAKASHNAYRRIGVPIVVRWIACRPGGPWFIVDRALGSGTHRLTSRLHLDPAVLASLVGDDCVEIRFAGRRVELRPLAPGTVTITSAWHCPEFGVRHASPVVAWTADCPLPTYCGWQVAWQPDEATASLVEAAPGEVALRWTDGGALAIPLA